MLLEETDGYTMGVERSMKSTYILFIDNYKNYQESHKIMKLANEITVQASTNDGIVMVRNV